MKEHLYDLYQKTGPAPVIKKLGALKMGMEQTPVIFKGEKVMAESHGPTKEIPYQNISVRNITTGQEYPHFGKDHHFASAFVKDDVLYVFATTQRDNKPMTMYVEEGAEWHDPRGGHEVKMFKTTDCINWEEKVIIHAPDRRMWNTSVCKGEDKYVMAIEVSSEEGFNIPEIGIGFTSFFAVSEDMENWQMLPDKYSYTNTRYNACPALRYSKGYYYMICLEALPCQRYAPYIYRTKDFENWEVGFHNPMMMWGDEDRIPKEGVVFTDEEMDLLRTGLNINCSDIDLFEYENKVHIYYSNGDQMHYSFLCEAVYDGTMDEFLEHFFK
ncbi:MAG: hypothetical protein E7564_07410 [Ruminococcaceae bacterium]|nr:hypothetical protein [Oscillospiraceae bacterium]